MEQESEERRSPFWDHLDELRSRLLKIFATVGVISFFCFGFGLRRTSFMGYPVYYPMPDLVDNIVSQLVRRVKDDLLDPDIQLIVVGPGDAVIAQIKVALFLGIALGMPMILYQIGRFVAPALREPEKRTLLRFTFPAAALFLAGCAFAYFFIIPFSFDFLYQYVRAMGALQFISIDEFISFVLLMSLAFGAVFELPVIMAGITTMGVVEPSFWKKNWRYAMVGMLLFGAVITPDGTGLTQLLVAAPMAVLYFAGYGASFWIHRRQRAKRSIPEAHV
jgi:sec-independent protein translocase protein TatC